MARDYFRRAKTRLRVLALLHEAGEYADVVREAQELVELALKGMLRSAGIDPPKCHDVGEILLDRQEMMPVAAAGKCLAVTRL